jgi:hypothetical protein
MNTDLLPCSTPLKITREVVMKSYSASFIHGIDAKELEARVGGERKLRMTFDPVTLPPGSEWLVCGLRDGAAPPSDKFLWGEASLTEQDSKNYGEIIFIFADVSPDSLVYEHARDGVLLRKLVWFPMLDDDWTPGWLCAQGEPEAWEAELFFTEQRLARVIAEEKERYRDRGEESAFPAREAEIRRVWEGRRIEARTTIPECSGDVALFIERHFGIVR